jgi:hypothetical protein
MQKIKEALLSTEQFLDNEWLDKYVVLVEANTATEPKAKQTFWDPIQKHHIIPRCYYKHAGLPVNNSKGNLVSLTVNDHANAHYFLVKASATGFMRSNMAAALNLIKHYGAELSNEATELVSETSSERMKALCEAGLKQTFKVPVRCVETNQVFDSITAAANYIGAQPPSIKRVLKNPEKTLRGFHWEYAGETWEEWRAKQLDKKKEPRLNFFTEEEVELLRKEYPNSGYNIPELLLRHSKQSIQGKAIALGIKVSETRRAARKRQVVCVETGQTFESVRAAQAFIGAGSLHDSLANGNATHGYHWKYLDQYSPSEFGDVTVQAFGGGIRRIG